MNRLEFYSNPSKWIIPLLLIVTISSCGGKKEVLGTNANAALAPSVTFMTPSNSASSVPVYKPVINATFNEPVTSTNFVVSCASPCMNPAGSVTADATNKIFTFTPASNLSAVTLYTATVTANGARFRQPCGMALYNWRSSSCHKRHCRGASG